MEGYTGCRDATFEIIEEASDEFGDSYFLNEEKYGKLNEICELVDEVVCDEDFECKAVTVDVDTTRKELIFNIECDEIILHNRHGMANPFYKLAALVDMITFSKARQDCLRIEIALSGLWLGGHIYE